MGGKRGSAISRFSFLGKTKAVCKTNEIRREGEAAKTGVVLWEGGKEGNCWKGLAMEEGLLLILKSLQLFLYRNKLVVSLNAVWLKWGNLVRKD